MQGQVQGSARPHDFSTRVVEDTPQSTIARRERLDDSGASVRDDAGSCAAGDLCVTCEARPGVPRPTVLRTVHCGPCWAAHGGSPDVQELDAPPSQALGSRDPQSQAEWIERLGGEEWVQLLQLRTRRKLCALIHKLASHADWSSFESWPTWDALIEATGWARSTMAAWLRQLRITGWLVTLEHGSTPQFRPMGIRPDEGNRAAVYGLRIPLRPGEQPATPTLLDSTTLTKSRQVTVDKTWTPTLSPLGESVTYKGGSFARESPFHNSPQRNSVNTDNTEALRARIDEVRNTFDYRCPTRRTEMLAAAAELQRQHSILAKLSAKWIRHLARPYWRAGWCNSDIRHALTYRPTSWSTLPAAPAESIVAPARWIAARLNAWRTAKGRVLPGRSQNARTLRKLKSTYGVEAVHTALGLPEHYVETVPDPALSAATLHNRLTPEAVRERGRREHYRLKAEHEQHRRRAERDAATQLNPLSAAAAAESRTQARRTFTTTQARRSERAADLREQLVQQARNHKTAEHTPAANVSPSTPPDDTLTPEERHQRALARAHAEGQPRRRRTRYRP